ncbi:UDP-N-acetylglucosamine--N-acetylmuramyl-(pentapeptide) pyrophosphoryl-undecaprenol N-acetylglucosamine transferase [subsurface metagenome]
MRIIFAGGGTGGHIYPAIAVAEEILNRQPDADILFISGTKEIERKIITDAGFSMKTLSVIGMPRKLSPVLIRFIFELGKSIMKSRKYLRDFDPSVVMATGGYVSAPPVIAARRLGIPVVIQEQNSYPGFTTRKLGRFADVICLGFGDAKKYFGKNAEIKVTGNPVRGMIGSADRGISAESFGLDPEIKTLLVFGGSQGSRAINGVFSEIAEKCAEKGFQVIWQTGENEFESMAKYNGSCNGRIRVLPYIGNMSAAYAASDLAVTRAGALTIAELTACGLPAVFIPLPSAAANHQEHNAVSLMNAGAAVMIKEKDLTPELLAKEIFGILASDDRRKEMSIASENCGNKDAAGVIAGMLLDRYAGN